MLTKVKDSNAQCDHFKETESIKNKKIIRKKSQT